MLVLYGLGWCFSVQNSHCWNKIILRNCCQSHQPIGPKYYSRQFQNFIHWLCMHFRKGLISLIPCNIYICLSTYLLDDSFIFCYTCILHPLIRKSNAPYILLWKVADKRLKEGHWKKFKFFGNIYKTEEQRILIFLT